MFIKNHLNLFCFTSIDDRRMFTLGPTIGCNTAWANVQTLSWINQLVPNLFTLLTHPRFLCRKLENFADRSLGETRYWLNGKKIEIYDDTVRSSKEIRNFTTLIDKIKSLATAIFCFVPAIGIKSVVWLFNGLEVYQRNKFILEHLKKQEQFNQQADKPLSKMQPRKFKADDPISHPAQKAKKDDDILQDDDSSSQDQDTLTTQDKSLFSLLPNEAIMHIFPYLEDQDRVKVSQTCTRLYHLTADFQERTINPAKGYPSVFVEAMGEETLLKLPHTNLPNNLQILLERVKEGRAILIDFHNKVTVEDYYLLGFLLTGVETVNSYLEDLHKTMGNHSIQTFSTPEGRGLLIRLKNNAPEHGLGNEETLIITKIDGKWEAICLNTSAAFSLFLKDISFSTHTPELLDYLTRLFKGELCGSFSDTVNAHIEVDYQVARAGASLQEGFRFCADGVTPVIQLWTPLK